MPIKLKKTIPLVFLLTGSSLFCPMLVSCAQNDNEIIINVPQAWSKSFNLEKITFFKQIEQKYNELKKLNDKTKDLPDIKIKVNIISDDRTLFDSALVHKNNISITTSNFLLQRASLTDYQVNLVKPFLQTLTLAPKYDSEGFFWVDNAKALQQSVMQRNELLTKKPFNEWKNDEYQYKNGIYQSFYDLKTKIPYYRGDILIVGSPETRSMIKTAWNEKDWQTFRSFNIALGESSSSSKYKFVELLFQKHFNLKKNQFDSFAIQKQKASSNFFTYPKGSGAKDMKSMPEVHIFLAEEGEWAYHNSQKEPTLYTPAKTDEQVEILTTTDPILFNVVVANKYMSDDVISLLQNAILSSKDDWGYWVGINGYEKTNADKITEFYKKAL
ncbi:ABC transporter thiamine pyrophosphate-binding lipoprotein p37/Cypl [Mycoplasma sp. 392]